MKKNRQSKLVFLALPSVAAILITAIYVKGTYDGRVGNEFSFMKEAFAAQKLAFGGSHDATTHLGLHLNARVLGDHPFNAGADQGRLVDKQRNCLTLHI